MTPSLFGCGPLPSHVIRRPKPNLENKHRTHLWPALFFLTLGPTFVKPESDVGQKKKVVYFSMTIPIFLLSQDLIYSTNNVSLGKIIFNAWDLCSRHSSLSTVVWAQGETWDAHDCRMKEEDRFSNPSLILSASGLGHSLHCKCWGVPGPTVGVLLAYGAQAEASVSCGLTLLLRVLRAS